RGKLRDAAHEEDCEQDGKSEAGKSVPGPEVADDRVQLEAAAEHVVLDVPVVGVVPQGSHAGLRDEQVGHRRRDPAPEPTWRPSDEGEGGTDLRPASRDERARRLELKLGAVLSALAERALKD